MDGPTILNTAQPSLTVYILRNAFNTHYKELKGKFRIYKHHDRVVVKPTIPVVDILENEETPAVECQDMEYLEISGYIITHKNQHTIFPNAVVDDEQFQAIKDLCEHLKLTITKNPLTVKPNAAN